MIVEYHGLKIDDKYLNTIQNNNEYKSVQLIQAKKKKLEELTKDLAQVQAGLIVPNIEEKKAEFRTLLNEVRVLEGKLPREIVGG